MKILTFATKQEQKRRATICASCPHKVNVVFCGLCGCVIAGKTKLQGASCPAGKW